MENNKPIRLFKDGDVERGHSTNPLVKEPKGSYTPSIDSIRVQDAKLRHDLQLRNEGLVKALQAISNLEFKAGDVRSGLLAINSIAAEALTQYNRVTP